MGLLQELRRTEHAFRRRYTPHREGAPILRAAGLALRYETGAALDDVSFELEAGSRTAVVGPNGAGKSTLFQIVAGVLNPTHGEVHIYGDEPGGHICIAYVPQRSQVDWSFPVSVADVVLMGRIGKMGLFRHRSARDLRLVEDMLVLVNLSELADRQIGQLSGGQQQRMFIARAMAQEAELVLMDEPLTGLDVNSQEDILGILDKLHDRGVTVLVALHDLKLAAERFESVMLLNRRLVGFGTPEEVFTPENLTAAYGGHLQRVSTDEGTWWFQDTCCDEGVPRGSS
jgi:manganese/iron transport system ATP-binding protein